MSHSGALAGIRVVLADDHAMVRLGFRLLLEGVGAEVLAEVENGEAVVATFTEKSPDVLVMDVSMPGIGGLAALERLLAFAPNARVLMLSAHNDDIVPSRALRLGARGYLCKRSDPAEFLRAVGIVARDQRYIDPQLAQSLALSQLAGSSNPVAVLTDKELAVFLKLAQGKSVSEVAESFCVSQSTIGTHLYHIKQKLNVQNAAELALIAVRNGLLEE
jgi:two-component system, NarL family, invasion response regulator UvrY